MYTDEGDVELGENGKVKQKKGRNKKKRGENFKNGVNPRDPIFICNAN